MYNSNYYDEGSCPIPQVYETIKEEIIIYNHEGEPLTQLKIPMGFDLTHV